MPSCWSVPFFEAIMVEAEQTAEQTKVPSTEVVDVAASGINVVNLVKSYKGGKVRALDGVSLSIKPGEALGLVGPNGAGKTTLIGCMMGFLRYQSGEITIDGLAPDDLVTRAMVGYLPERLTFDRWMTGRDFLHFHHELCGRPEKLRLHECEELLRKVELDPAAWSMAVRKYSRGMLQRLGFAQALVNKPRYLLLDEPASGMDPHGVLVVQSLLRGLRQDGLTFLLNSHQLDQIERSCDRVIFIQKGKVVREENLRTREESVPRTMCISWLGYSDEVLVDSALVSKIATELGATLEQFSQTEANASITVGSEAECARLIKTMVEAGIPVTRVVPELSRLQKAFVDEMSKGGAK